MEKTVKTINIPIGADLWKIPFVSQLELNEAKDEIIEAILAQSSGSEQLDTNIGLYQDLSGTTNTNYVTYLQVKAQMIAGELHIVVSDRLGNIFADEFAPYGTASLIMTYHYAAQAASYISPPTGINQNTDSIPFFDVRPNGLTSASPTITLGNVTSGLGLLSLQITGKESDTDLMTLGEIYYGKNNPNATVFVSPAIVAVSYSIPKT